MDIFEYGNNNYLLLVDYYSKFIEVNELRDLGSYAVIEALKSQFCRHGIPERCRSDNGPQFSCQDFKRFCLEYGVHHTTSSPYFPQSNGEAESAIQTVKRMWKKTPDKHGALLDYRTTPLEGLNLSPAQLLMSRRPRNILPSSRKLLAPAQYSQAQVKQHFERQKQKQEFYHNYKPGVKQLPPLAPGQPVRMSPSPGSKEWKPATVIKEHGSPRSYIVKCETNNWEYRRNRRQLRGSSSQAHQNTTSMDLNDMDTPDTGATSSDSTIVRTTDDLPTSLPPTHSRIVPVKTRCGRTVKQPVRLDL